MASELACCGSTSCVMCADVALGETTTRPPSRRICHWHDQSCDIQAAVPAELYAGREAATIWRRITCTALEATIWQDHLHRESALSTSSRTSRAGASVWPPWRWVTGCSRMRACSARRSRLAFTACRADRRSARRPCIRMMVVFASPLHYCICLCHSMLLIAFAPTSFVPLQCESGANAGPTPLPRRGWPCAPAEWAPPWAAPAAAALGLQSGAFQLGDW
jgi:hypothetical protein